MSISILGILDLQPPLSSLNLTGTFQEIYVKIAEATSDSRDALDKSLEPLSDSEDYLGTGLEGNIEVIRNLRYGTSFEEENISEVVFVVANLNPAIATYSSLNNKITNAYCGPVVTSLNNYVINRVLGEESEAGTDDGKYQSTLQLFIENDCVWTEGSAPQTWLDLCTHFGFTVQ